MKKFLITYSFISAMGFNMINAQQQPVIPNPSYPKPIKEVIDDQTQGTAINDSYRWLETPGMPGYQEWISAQNEITQNYLSQIPFRDSIKSKIERLWNFTKFSVPVEKNGKLYYSKNDGLQNQPVLYVRDLKNNSDKVIIDPNSLSKDGTVSMVAFKISKDGKYLAYALSSGGSDWNEIMVMDLMKMKSTKDRVKWVKFSDIAWHKDGFYYSCYDAPKDGAMLSGKNEFHKVFYHKIGDDQSKDKLIFENRDKPSRNYEATVTEDERFLVISESESTNGNAVYIKNLSSGDGAFKPVIEGFEYNNRIIGNFGDTLLLLTNEGAPGNRLVMVPSDKPDRAHWKEFIAESEKGVLETAIIAGNKLVVKYMIAAVNEIMIIDRNGQTQIFLSLPSIGSVGDISGINDQKRIFFMFTSFNYLPTIYSYDLSADLMEPYFQTGIKEIRLDEIVVRQVYYPSKDGNEIPMFLVHKANIELNGNNPTLLYGYGGFNLSLTPNFSVSRLVFLDNGGIYAMANLRGGGEFGEKWHKAGMREKKQNVFDDFIAAAEYLIKEGYTRPEKLAISGGSNGGLLVGACMTQRPDLFKVALPAVGVMDMLRFHLFTIGWAWVDEYGSPDDPEAFKYLIKYSPLHNIKEGVSYPATLATTADHDDRVVPAHSYKFIATLQELGMGPNPYLIRIATKAGHGAGKPTNMVIEEMADVYAFLYFNLGMKFVDRPRPIYDPRFIKMPVENKEGEKEELPPPPEEKK